MWVFYLSYGVFLLCGLFIYAGVRLFRKKQTKKSAIGLRLLQTVSILFIIGLALYDCPSKLFCFTFANKARNELYSDFWTVVRTEI